VSHSRRRQNCNGNKTKHNLPSRCQKFLRRTAWQPSCNESSPTIGLLPMYMYCRSVQWRKCERLCSAVACTSRATATHWYRRRQLHAEIAWKQRRLLDARLLLAAREVDCIGIKAKKWIAASHHMHIHAHTVCRPYIHKSLFCHYIYRPISRRRKLSDDVANA